MRESFGAMLAQFRARTGKSRSALAHEVHVDPSYLTRIEHGDRVAPRPHIIEDLARVLRLTKPERNRFLIAAGFVPDPVAEVWDDSLQAAVDVLNDVYLSEEERDDFRQTLRLIAARWKPNLATLANGRESIREHKNYDSLYRHESTDRPDPGRTHAYAGGTNGR